MKSWLSALIMLIALQGGCRKATFQNIEDKAKNSGDSTGNGGGGNGSGGDNINGPAGPGGNGGNGNGGQNPAGGKVLIVTVPVTELPFGKTTDATAKLKDGTKEPVTWKINAPPGKDGGTITDAGVVTPPKTGTEPLLIEVVAELKSDPKVSGKVPLTLLPNSGKPELIVTVPVSEIKIGSNMTTAVAKLKDGTLNPPVKWTIMGPAMRDSGKIDEKAGVYTSPATGTESFVVLITATLIADPTISGSVNLTVVPLNPMNAGLIVEIPSPEIKAGGKEMQATARLKDGTMNPPVTWTLIAPAGVTEFGSISDKGVYKSPAKADKDIPLQIVAALVANDKITASVPLTVLKDDQLFARCKKASVIFPIVADVYKIPNPDKFLPSEWKKENYETTVCMENYNVPITPFTAGFPDVPGLTENFGMTTRTNLIINTPGDYYFQLLSDDGSKLWINNEVVVNNDGEHEAIPGKEKSHDKPLKLTAGKHPLRVDYFQGPRFSIALMLFWKKPGETQFTIVPRSAFD
ncbi:MAG: hypothetical protein EOP04_01010 [Proteobacteria bacterium]|nr:MAG: hypothetical protein EOP04_01010 [Pseudomonadota bacterium]